MKNYFILLLIPFLFQSCEAMLGKEIARITISELSSKDHIHSNSTTLDLKEGDEIFIWSDMDFEYEDNLKLMFQFSISKDGTFIGGLEFDPTEKNISVKETKTSIMGKTKWSFSGKNKTITIEENGNYTFEAVLQASGNIKSLKLNKADIVLKQKSE